MKQYTTPEQTAKLIKLGLPKPRYYNGDKYFIIHVGFEAINYSIGELIEMLERADDIEINRYDRYWSVSVGYEGAKDKELIDALYDMIIKLKEEGVV